ncbi:MAG: CHAT domain-containing protein [Saprospiraceae bacterium]|nr:CHAT domain-containing protein [Saprospiraceae bacterium]
MKNLNYLLVFLFLPFMIWGQNMSNADALIKKAEKAIDSGKLESAHLLLTEAATIFENAKAWEDYVDCGVRITSNLIKAGEYDLGIQLAETFLKKSKEISISNISLSLLHKNLGKIFYIKNNYKAALPYLEQALVIREKINPKDPELGRDYGNLGIISRYSNRYGKAIEYLNKATELQDNDDVLARLYSELGTNYKLVGNFRKSLDNQNQALRILENGNNAHAIALALFEKGAILTELKKEGEDISYIKKALKIFESPDALDYTNQINCYKQLGYSYSQFSQITSKVGYLDSAQFYYQKGLDISEEQFGIDNQISYDIILSIGSILTHKKDFIKANKLIDRSEKIALNFDLLEGEGAYNMFGVKAEINKAQGNYNLSLKFYQQQLITLIDNYEETDILLLPDLEKTKKSLSHNAMTDVLASKARCWYQYYKYGGNDIKNLEEGLKTIHLFDQLIDVIRADFSNSGSNIAWSDLCLDAYENAIEICLALEKETSDNNYKKEALYFSEKSKGLTLLESFQNTKANRVAGLSESDLIKERELKLDIVDLEQSIFLLSQEQIAENNEKIKELKKKMFLKKKTYQDFIEKLEINNPEYYNIKYKLDILSLEEIQALLKKDQAFIEYFIGDSSVFAFKITKSSLETFTLEGEESMQTRVGDLRKSIYGYFLFSRDRSDQMKSKYAQQYTKGAHRMYKNLIEPLGALPKHLIIIPAGPMCDMPFETFLTNPVKDPLNYKAHPYLIKDHIISYSYSATLLKEMVNKEHQPTTGVYLGFAPSFGKSSVSVVRGQRFSLSPLAFNKTEIHKVNQLLGTGTIFEDATATENKFKELASDYKIIHFATHGMANSEDPDYSLLAFTLIDDDKENEFLYVGDMYNLKLNAEMVVLSACETALGKNFRGEGIMSLARGFSYAGAKSIFTTLWSVNDQSTYEIIKAFYFHLQEGMDKDEALQKSKLDYINKANNFSAHPFLWSPYILIGDCSYIPAISNKNLWLYIIGGSLFVIILGYMLRKKLKNKPT